MADFKGFKQVTLSTYLATSEENRKDYLWFVRELSGESVISVAIYLGNRKYADLTGEAAEVKVENLIHSLGSFVDENGEWVGFLPIEEHEILGNSGVTSVEDALSALEAAIIANADAISGKASKEELNEKVAELTEYVNSAISQESAAVEELSEEVELTQSALTREIQIREETISALTEFIVEKFTVTGDDVE